MITLNCSCTNCSHTTKINQDQLRSTKINQDHQRSIRIIQYQPRSTYINQGQSRLARVNQHELGFTHIYIYMRVYFIKSGCKCRFLYTLVPEELKTSFYMVPSIPYQPRSSKSNQDTNYDKMLVVLGWSLLSLVDIGWFWLI